MSPYTTFDYNSSIYFKLSTGGILFALGTEGFHALPKDMPGVWVVAPTRDAVGLGFSINGTFDLDIGRATLARNSPSNKQKALELGEEFGKVLSYLFEWTKSTKWDVWNQLGSDYSFENESSVYEFWESLWKITTVGFISHKDNSEVASILNNLLCDGCGLGYLISNADALPNGLGRGLQVLTSPDKVKYVLHGVLAEDENVIHTLLRWPFFKSLIGTTSQVITQSMYDRLKRILSSDDETDLPSKLNLSDVLQRYVDTDIRITPDNAKPLGSLFNRNALKEEKFREEKEAILKYFYKFTFKANDGNFYPADQLLLSEKHVLANPDEISRASFAPGKYVISSQYQNDALEFFFVCREEIALPIESMIQWVADAEAPDKREGALRYLLKGEHAKKLLDTLRKKREQDNHWLSKQNLDPSSPYFNGWDENDVNELLLRILPSIEDICKLTFKDKDPLPAVGYPDDVSDFDRFKDLDPIVSQTSPNHILEKIFNWWENCRDRILAEYEKGIYPNGVFPNLKEDGDSGEYDRKSWLTLFALSHFHTMGRQTADQHRGFIELCEQEGWWLVFSKKDPGTRHQEWMGVLDEFFDNQVDRSKYENWINCFPAIYKFSKWMDDYRELLLRIDSARNLDDILGILTPRSNPIFQGGGVSPPPIMRSLGIGACFAFRELKRKNYLNSNTVIPYCYVPVKRVRLLCEKIGCKQLSADGIENSRIIYEFLCKYLSANQATFSNAFDIPLQYLALDENRNTLMEILEQG